MRWRGADGIIDNDNDNDGEGDNSEWLMLAVTGGDLTCAVMSARKQPAVRRGRPGWAGQNVLTLHLLCSASLLLSVTPQQAPHQHLLLLLLLSQ